MRRLIDALLGHPCLFCGQRVRPRDLAMHFHNEHAGDTR